MMRHAAGRRRVAAVAALLLLAGCGNALAGSSAAGPAAGAARAVTGPAAGGPEARALALARRLVSELRLPAGAAPERLSTLPTGLAAPGEPSPGWARATRIFAVRATPRTVWTALLTHAPFNEAPPASVLPQAVSATTPAPEPGVDAAIASVSVAPLSQTMTAVVAYADAAWQPVRSPAEHLGPADFRAVTASVINLLPSSRAVARTSTSAQVIVEMTAYLNALQPVPQIVMSCPAPTYSFTISFIPKASRSPTVLVTADGCPRSYQVTVNGRAQPPLWDTDGLETIARDGMGLPLPS
jgi:hypothetical protein